MSDLVERVARAIDPAAFVFGAAMQARESAIASARRAIDAMHTPPDRVLVAVEAMAEERYRAAPDMQRWYGEDVWNAGIDAALG